MTSDSAQSSLYTPIREWQTRLLCLQPGHKNEPLHATLHVVDLVHIEGVVEHDTARVLKYEALSYTWGNRKALHPVQVNESFVEVTENLFDALLNLRTEDEQRWVWIDALCIHQTDLVEKSQHLGRMFLIFRKAYRVIVYLGPAGPETAHTFEYLRSYRNIEPPAGFIACEHPEPAMQARLHQIDELLRLCQGLSDLWTRPWQCRIWVRQEVFAARQILVLCGHDQLTWDEFGRLPYAIDEISTQMRDHGREIVALENRKILNFRRLRYSQRDALSRILNKEYSDERGACTDIVQVLNNSIGCEMSDSRDQIYAILGMTKTMLAPLNDTSSDETGASLVVDYSKDLASVFVDVGKYLFKRDRTPHILYLRNRLPLSDDISLPSWCPDWRYESVSYFVRLNDEVMCGPSFRHLYP